MAQRGRFFQRCTGVLALLLGAMPQSPPAAADSAQYPSAQLEGRIPLFYRRSFDLAVKEARRKLDGVECQNVFGDFVDGEGRPLADKLVGIGQTAGEYFRDIHFVDGQWSAACAPGHVYAWTRSGSRTIHLCLDRFARLARVSPSDAANILIHEELHALGLGENPPESLRITSRVGQRCGS